MVLVDENNHDGVIFDKMWMFGQVDGDTKISNPLSIAVSHHLIAVSKHKNHVVKIFSLQETSCLPGSDNGGFKFPQGVLLQHKRFAVCR